MLAYTILMAILMALVFKPTFEQHDTTLFFGWLAATLATYVTLIYTLYTLYQGN
jgi:hypothetical protein